MTVSLHLVEDATKHDAPLSEWERELLGSLPPVMSPRTFGEAFEISAPTLSRWRSTWPRGARLGPAFTSPRGTNIVRYTRGDVARWLSEARINPKEEV